MRWRMLYNILSHLRANMNRHIESLEDARSFISKMTGLTPNERLFLQAILFDSESVATFHASLSDALRTAAEGPGNAR